MIIYQRPITTFRRPAAKKGKLCHSCGKQFTPPRVGTQTLCKPCDTIFIMEYGC